jgi:hypothetical protein
LTLVAFVLVGSQPAGAAPDDKSYSVVVDLDRVCATDTTTLTFTYTNTSTTSTQRMRGARVTVPAGYAITGVGTPVASGGQSWSSGVSGGTVTIVANNANGDQGILPGMSVAVALTLATPTTGATDTFVTQADQNSTFGGDGNAFLRIGADPSVATVDCALILTATPDPVSAGASVTIGAAVVDGANPGAGPVLSYSGTLSYGIDGATPACAYPESGTTAIFAGQGSFTLTALSGIGASDDCTVDGSVKLLAATVTFAVDGSAALCGQNQASCRTGSEVAAGSVMFASVFCTTCKLPTTLVADYLEDRCTGAEASACQALFMANSTTPDVPFFIDVTVIGTPRGQVTIIAELNGVFVDLGSCRQNAPPCIASVSGSGSTNTWRVLLATDPPIGVR